MTKSGSALLYRFRAGCSSNGVQLWKSFANAQGCISIHGDIAPAVRLIWYDDGSRISRTRENVLRPIGNDCVDVLLGPYSSSLTSPELLGPLHIRLQIVFRNISTASRITLRLIRVRSFEAWSVSPDREARK